MSGPLDGYRVVELTSTVSGPIAGMILADQGADVIKIEPPMTGDLARYMGSSRNGMGAMYAVLNRNKRSLVLDFKDASDKNIFSKLIQTADVLSRIIGQVSLRNWVLIMILCGYYNLNSSMCR